MIQRLIFTAMLSDEAAMMVAWISNDLFDGGMVQNHFRFTKKAQPEEYSAARIRSRLERQTWY